MQAARLRTSRLKPAGRAVAAEDRARPRRSARRGRARRGSRRAYTAKRGPLS
jgi:hypothetical protein